MEERLDEVDFKILNLLQEDSRLSYNKIAEKIGISVGTAYNRVKNLEEKGVLKRYTALVDAAKIGYNLTALILIQAEGKHLVEVENEIAAKGSTLAVYDITGEFDIAVIARFRDRESLNQFIKSLLGIPHIKRTVTNVVLNTVKEDFTIKINGGQ